MSFFNCSEVVGFRVALLSGLSGTKSMIFSHCRHLHRRDLRRGASLTSDEFLLVFRQIGHGFSIPTFTDFLGVLCTRASQRGLAYVAS